jgi:hypothetical protein
MQGHVSYNYQLDVLMEDQERVTNLRSLKAFERANGLPGPRLF